MSEIALETIGLRKRYGALVATDDVDLRIEHGELHAIIGPNGAGKTTLVSQLSGQIMPTAGDIRFYGRSIAPLRMPQRARIGIVRSFQITALCPDFSTLINVALAVQAHAGHSFGFWRDATRDPRFVEPARRALAEVGLDHRADTRAGSLSHGEKRQLELAIALAAEPKILLLDEPMAGMGTEESLRVVDLLKRLKRRYTIVLVEHDMDAVFALADRISVLVYGRRIATGTPDEVRSAPEVLQSYLGEDAA